MDKLVFLLYFSFIATCFGSNDKSTTSYALKFVSSSKQFVDLKPVVVGSTFTVDFYINWTGTGTQPVLYFASTDTKATLFVFIKQETTSTARIGLTLCANDGTCKTAYQTTDVAYQNRWVYVVVRGLVASSETRVSFYYRDDETLNSDGDYSNFPVCPSSLKQKSYIGTDGTNYFDGQLTKIRVWSRFFDDLLSLFQLAADSKTPRLIAYWPCDEGSGSVVLDYSPNNCHGSLGGGKSSQAPTFVYASPQKRKSCTVWGCKLHLQEFDGTYQSFSTYGDYWFSRSSSFDVQIRTNSKSLKRGATVTAVGIKFANDVVVVDLDFYGKSDSSYYINGVEQLQDEVTLSSGLSIDKDYYSKRQQYVIRPKNGSFKLKINAYPKKQETTVSLVVSYDAFYNTALTGICGNFTKAASSLTPITSGSFFTNLRITDPIVNTFTCDIQTLYAGTPLLSEANAVCANSSIVSPDLSDACFFDVCSSQEISGAVDSAQASYDACVLQYQNGDTSKVCNPVCPNFCSFNGDCLNGVCRCYGNYTGTDCSVLNPYNCFKAVWKNGAESLAMEPFVGPVNVRQHYSYNDPVLASASTGHEISQSTVVYFYLNNLDNATSNLVLIHDLPRDGSGGYCYGRLRAFDGNNNPLNSVQIAAKDDPTFPFGDDYIEKSSGNTIEASWLWGSCCTDGIALSNLPLRQNFCVTADLSYFVGINQLYLAQQNSFGGQDLQVVPLSDIKGLRLCGGVCTNPCANYNNCTACTSDSKCGWCGDSGTCVQGTAGGPSDGLCQSWRYSIEPSVSRVIETNIDYPVSPSSISVHLDSSSSVSASFAVNVPTYETVPQQVVLVQELTSNWNSDLKSYASKISALYQGMLNSFPSTQLALASFSDKPILPYGSATRGDYAYRTDLGLTTNQTLINQAATSWKTLDGRDNANSQLEALFQATLRDELGWTDNSRHIVIIVSRSDFHDVENDKNLVANNNNTVLDSNENYPTRAAVRAALLKRNVFPVFVVSDDFTKSYNGLVNSLGFGLVSTFSKNKVSSIFDAILSSLTQVAGTVVPVIKTNGRISKVNGAYYGISPLTRVFFGVDMNSQSTSNVNGEIVVPGFGQVTIKYVSSDLPVAGSCPNATVLSSQDLTFRLSGSSPIYGDALRAQIISIPSSSFGVLYQYQNGQTGPAIAPGDLLTDRSNRLIFRPDINSNGTVNFSYKFLDDCQACSQVVSCAINVIYDAPQPQPISTNVNTTKNTLSPPIPLVPASFTGKVRARITKFPNLGGKLFNNNTLTEIDRSGIIADLSYVIRYLPPNNQIGQPLEVFTYVLLDNTGAPKPRAPTPGVVESYVLPTLQDRMPTANDSSVNTDDSVGNSVTVSLVAADGIYDPGVLLYTITTGPTLGRLARPSAPTTYLNAPFNLTNNQVVYSANTNQIDSFADQFKFTVTNKNGYTATATVRVSVKHINRNPSGNDNSFTVNMDSSNNVLQLSGATDLETPNSLIYVLNSYSGTGNIVSFSSNGTVVYTPKASTFGSDAFYFTISDPDGGSTGVYTATIIVNRVNYAPTTNPTSPQSGVQNATVTITLTADDSNTDDHPLTLIICDFGSSGTFNQSNGALLAKGDSVFNVTKVSSTRTVGYLRLTVPVGNAQTSYTFIRYSARDNARNTTCATVNIDVQNQYPPVVTGPASVTLDQYGSKQFSLTATDLDSAQSSLSFTLQSLPSSGSLYNGSSCSGIALSANAKIDSSGSLCYKPASSFNGQTSLTFTASDGTYASNPFTTSITVNRVNIPPTANDQLVSVPENSNLQITLSGSDPDSNSLTYSIAGTPWGTIAICQDAACTSTAIGASGSIVPYLTLIYTPQNFFFGLDSFSFTIYDGENISNIATVTVNVTFVNQAPSAIDGSYNTVFPQSSFLVITFNGTDVDNSDSQLTATVVDTNFKGLLYQYNSTATDLRGSAISGTDVPVTDSQRRVVYQSIRNDAGTSPFAVIQFRINDPYSASSSIGKVNIYVTNSLSKPIALTTRAFGTESSSLLITFNASDSNPGTPIFRAVITQLPLYGTLTQVGTNATVQVGDNATDFQILYTPPYIGYGDPYDNFRHVVYNDATGLASDDTTVAISLTHVNHPPTAFMLSTPTGFEDSNVNITLGGSDPDGDTITFIIVQTPARGLLYNLLPDGSVVLVSYPLFSLTGNKVMYVPSTKFGSPYDSFSYLVQDSAGAFSNGGQALTVSIDIIHVNHPPTASSANYTGPNNAASLLLSLNGADIDDMDVLTGTIITLPAKGTLYTDAGLTSQLTLANPNFTLSSGIWFKPNTFGDFGNPYTSFTYSVTDGMASSPIATASIFLTLVNYIPTLGNGPTSFFLTTGNTTRITTFMNMTDLDDPSINWRIIIRSLPTNTRLSDPSSPITVTVGYAFRVTNLAQGFRLGLQVINATANTGTVADTFQFQLFDGRDFNPSFFTFSIFILPINQPPAITCSTSYSKSVAANTADSVIINNLQVSDPDARSFSLTVTITTDTTVCQSISLSNPSKLGANNYGTNGANQIWFTQSQSTINSALLDGLVYQTKPLSASATGTINIVVNDNGNFGSGGARSATSSPKVTVTVTSGSAASSASPFMQPGSMSGALIGGTTAISMGVYGVYRLMKRRKLLPEDADPWEADEDFDKTLDNPLYSGTPTTTTATHVTMVTSDTDM